MFKHLDGQNQAELKNYKLVQGQLFNVNGKNHYRGVAPYPVTPAVGNTWEELNATGLWVESWFWDGNYWLSCQKYEINSYFNGITASTSNFPAIELRGDNPVNLFLLKFRVSPFSSGLSATAFWNFQLLRYSLTGSNNQLANLNNQSLANSNWHILETPLNLHLNVDSLNMRGINFNAQRQSTPGALSANFALYYRKARI